MSYKSYFGNDFEIGIELNHLPVKLIDRSYSNDICPSFYFQIANNFYLLWVDYKNKEDREDQDSSRYTITKAINEGDDINIEISTAAYSEDLLETEHEHELVNFIKCLSEGSQQNPH